MSSPAVTVVGLDSATLEVVRPLADAGELPTLAPLLTSGSSGVLRSTTHPLTPHAWGTLVTGVNAGRHGLWDFAERDETGYRLRVVNGSHRRAPAIWDYLSAAGRTVGIVNVPFTSPAPAVNGFALAGLDAAVQQAADFAHPAGLMREIHARFGELQLDHRFPLDRDGNVDLETVRRACEQRAELVAWLVERFRPELLFVVFMSADHVHHLLWPEWEERGLDSRVAEVYRILDRAAGAVLDAAGRDGDVAVVSDHGAGRLDGVVNLNAWLAQEGLLAYAGSATQVRSGELGRRLAAKALEARRRLPPALRRAASRRLPAARRRVHELRDYSVVDWRRTRAFAYGTFGNVVVNLRGRERDGIVEPDDYDAVRDEVAERVLELRDADGAPIVVAAHRREDLFSGPELERLPDLLIEFDDYRWLGKGNLKRRTDGLRDEITIPPHDRTPYLGSHRHDGMLALAGPSVAAGRAVFASIEDVAPTILYLLDEAIPTTLEGRVLTEVLDEHLLERRPPRYAERVVDVAAVSRHTGEAADEVESRLRSLGYLE